jgi:hypothetical protein
MDVDGSIEMMREPWKLLALALLGKPVDHRRKILGDFLAGRSDAKEVIDTIANADATKPMPPVDSAPSGSDWPALRLDVLPPVDLFPVDVLPDPAARLVKEGADAIGCPRDFLGIPVLAVAGGTIGRSASLILARLAIARLVAKARPKTSVIFRSNNLNIT